MCWMMIIRWVGRGVASAGEPERRRRLAAGEGGISGGAEGGGGGAGRRSEPAATDTGTVVASSLAWVSSGSLFSFIRAIQFPVIYRPL